MGFKFGPWAIVVRAIGMVIYIFSNITMIGGLFIYNGVGWVDFTIGSIINMICSFQNGGCNRFGVKGPFIYNSALIGYELNGGFLLEHNNVAVKDSLFNYANSLHGLYVDTESVSYENSVVQSYNVDYLLRGLIKGDIIDVQCNGYLFDSIDYPLIVSGAWPFPETDITINYLEQTKDQFRSISSILTHHNEYGVHPLAVFGLFGENKFSYQSDLKSKRTLPGTERTHLLPSFCSPVDRFRWFKS